MKKKRNILQKEKKFHNAFSSDLNTVNLNIFHNPVYQVGFFEKGYKK